MKGLEEIDASPEYMGMEMEKIRNYGTINFNFLKLQFTLYLNMAQGAYAHIYKNYKSNIWKALYCMDKPTYNNKWVAQLQQ